MNINFVKITAYVDSKIRLGNETIVYIVNYVHVEKVNRIDVRDMKMEGHAVFPDYGTEALDGLLITALKRVFREHILFLGVLSFPQTIAVYVLVVLLSAIDRFLIKGKIGVFQRG